MYTAQYSRKPPRPAPVLPASTVPYSHAHMYPAPPKEVPDYGVRAVNEMARVPALQGSVSLGSFLKLVSTYLRLSLCDECVGICDIAFSQRHDDYFARSVLSILYCLSDTEFLEGRISIFLCISQSPAKVVHASYQTPLCLRTVCSWYCGKHILSVMTLSLQILWYLNPALGLWKAEAWGHYQDPRVIEGTDTVYSAQGSRSTLLTQLQRLLPARC